MNYKTYMDEVKKTRPNLGNEDLDEIHMAIGISTESGEILDTYKKLLAYDKEVDIVNLKEELGDIFWYIFNLMRMKNLDFEDILDTNIRKLRTRFKDTYTRDEALNRNLNAERKVLENVQENQ